MPWSDFVCVCVSVLGVRLLGGAVGKVLELLLVDLPDDGLVGGREHGVLLGEVLVKVVHVALGFLRKESVFFFLMPQKVKEFEQGTSLKTMTVSIQTENGPPCCVQKGRAEVYSPGPRTLAGTNSNTTAPPSERGHSSHAAEGFRSHHQGSSFDD